MSSGMSSSEGRQHQDATWQAGNQEMDAFDRDLNPTDLAGRNEGLHGQHPEKGNPRTAYDAKEVHRQLQGFTDDELKQIPIMPDGFQLEQGATYVDLLGERREIRATAEMTTGEHQAWVAKTEVDYQLWNRLIGVDDAERTGSS